MVRQVAGQSDDGNLQGIDTKLREKLLVARIDELQADVKQAEEASKAAKEQAFRLTLCHPPYRMSTSRQTVIVHVASSPCICQGYFTGSSHCSTQGLLQLLAGPVDIMTAAACTSCVGEI